jgi:hypothetical protein
LADHNVWFEIAKERKVSVKGVGKEAKRLFVKKEHGTRLWNEAVAQWEEANSIVDAEQVDAGDGEDEYLATLDRVIEDVQI